MARLFLSNVVLLLVVAIGTGIPRSGGQLSSRAPSLSDLPSPGGLLSTLTSTGILLESLSQVVGDTAAQFPGLTLSTFASAAAILAGIQSMQLDTFQGASVGNDTRLIFQWLQDLYVCAALQNTATTETIANSTNAQLRTRLAQALRIPTSDVLRLSTANSLYNPVYAVYLNNTAQEVVVVVRGSASQADWLSDFTASCVRLPNTQGCAHQGMLTAATRIWQSERARLTRAVTDNSGYSVKLVGHSLGAGVTALLGMYLRTSQREFVDLVEGGGGRVYVSAYSTPPVATMNLASSREHAITTLGLQDDVVIRMSVLGGQKLFGEAGFLVENWLKSYSPALLQEAEALFASSSQLMPHANESLLAGLRLFADGRNYSLQLNDTTTANPGAPGAFTVSLPPLAMTALSNAFNISRNWSTCPTACPLFSPGQLYHIRKPYGEPLWQVVAGSSPLTRWSRILLKQDMICNHFIASIAEALVRGVMMGVPDYVPTPCQRA